MKKEEILELAAFNKLTLSGAEEVEMEKYLQFAEVSLKTMLALETAGVFPMVYSVDLTNQFRADEVYKNVSREELLANAPQQSEGCFQVPMVVE